MDRINSLKGVVITGFDIKLDGEKESTALITLETDYGKKQFVFDKIKEIAEEKQLLMINEV
jgi:ACT domain-containing protein